MREVFADPLLAGELPGDQELVEIAEAAPNAAAAVVKLFRAYREQAERLSDLSEMLARDGRATSLSSARLPIDEVRETFERRPNYFASIEEESEAMGKHVREAIRTMPDPDTMAIFERISRCPPSLPAMPITNFTGLPSQSSGVS